MDVIKNIKSLFLNNEIDLTNINIYFFFTSEFNLYFARTNGNITTTQIKTIRIKNYCKYYQI